MMLTFSSALSVPTSVVIFVVLCFFFNDTATSEIYTLSLHDALPISLCRHVMGGGDIPFCLRPTFSTKRSEEHTSELQSLAYLVCRLLLEKKNLGVMLAAALGILCVPHPASPACFVQTNLVSDIAGLAIFFFNGSATPEVYTLSLHNALPI